MQQAVQVNAVESRQLFGVPRFELSSVLSSDSIEERRRVIRQSLRVSAATSEAEAPLTVSNSTSLIVKPDEKKQTDFKRDRPEASASDDVIDLNSATWRQRRETLGSLSCTSNSAPTTEKEIDSPGSKSRQSKWKISKILVGHQGWVWAAAVDPTNSWFATGGFDSVIKVWDLASGSLKLNLTGHKEAIRSIALSKTSPYMFSGSDDHSIKCWDLERNEVIREFFGHRSAVHCVSVHPALDVVVSGGRDNTVRVWDIRSRTAVHTLVGHQDSVMSLTTQSVDPQIISGGSDGIIYMWDLAAGKAMARLTRHKKPVRGLALSPSGGELLSCGADEIRVWQMPTGEFVGNASTIVSKKSSKRAVEMSYLWSCCAMSARGTLAVGAQDGHLAFYDWNEQTEQGSHSHASPFYRTQTKSIPGTIQGEGGINCMVYDASGTRLITTESDKSVKIWEMKERSD